MRSSPSSRTPGEGRDSRPSPKGGIGSALTIPPSEFRRRSSVSAGDTRSDRLVVYQRLVAGREDRQVIVVIIARTHVKFPGSLSCQRSYLLGYPPCRSLLLRPVAAPTEATRARTAAQGWWGGKGESTAAQVYGGNPRITYGKGGEIKIIGAGAWPGTTMPWPVPPRRLHWSAGLSLTAAVGDPLAVGAYWSVRVVSLSGQRAGTPARAPVVMSTPSPGGLVDGAGPPS